jgi:DNA (cytosine-5)-methyltransferase 1
MIKTAELFAGIGGIRLGFEQACQQLNIKTECVFSSEIKPHAIAVYENNFSSPKVQRNIIEINTKDIPDFDILLAGFPCQSFSTAGTQDGLTFENGGLFYQIIRVLKAKKPTAFILENVDNLYKHDKGKTFEIIAQNLEKNGYIFDYNILDSKHFGIAQSRKRIYIIGVKSDRKQKISLDLEGYRGEKQVLGDILESGQDLLNTDFTKKLISRYHTSSLIGKSIKDKRGGQNNIHSWDLELKGTVNDAQKELLNLLLKERRKKEWAKRKGIEWMDGMPLTLAEISSFYTPNTLFGNYCLSELLDDLVKKGYLKYEHPKDLIEVAVVSKKGKAKPKTKYIEKRVPRTDLAKGYNIVTGKLSFEITKILNPNEVTPTLVATDMAKLAVVDGEGIRRLTIREGLRLFGFSEDYQMSVLPDKGFDLLGNTVPVPVIEQVSLQLLKQLLNQPTQQVQQYRHQKMLLPI